MERKYKIKLISFLWIGLGTLMQISSYPAYNFLGFDYDSLIFYILYLITLPFNILVFGMLYTEKLSNIYVLIILLQSVKVLIYWLIIYNIIKSKTKSNNI